MIKKTLLQKKIMAKLFSYFCEEEELKYKLDKKKTFRTWLWEPQSFQEYCQEKFHLPA